MLAHFEKMIFSLSLQSVEESARSMAVAILIVLDKCSTCEATNKSRHSSTRPTMWFTGKVDDVDMLSDLKRLAKAHVVSCGLGRRED